ncbi:fatty acid-binding protein-like [Oppia nitens]|uniref:fatty acid-binding protein-like n=1 Tax=Oppia nitens TaxID=1686743 RepID=UPI0023DAAFEC|nr:fatty acid-binding protein-like [Oppia nitens]
MFIEAKPLLMVSKQDYKWTIKTYLADRTHEIQFELGKQFQVNRPNGTIVKSTIVSGTGRQLIQTQIDGSMEMTIVRDFNGPDLVTTATVGDTVQAKWFYTENFVLDFHND